MVEDYLTDRDQEEALRNWWRENWKRILAGVALGRAAGRLSVLADATRPAGGRRPRRSTPTSRRRLAGNDVEQAGTPARPTWLREPRRSPPTPSRAAGCLPSVTPTPAASTRPASRCGRVVDTSSDEEPAYITRLRPARLQTRPAIMTRHCSARHRESRCVRSHDARSSW